MANLAKKMQYTRQKHKFFRFFALTMLLGTIIRAKQSLTSPRPQFPKGDSSGSSYVE